jgi:hypothetical protein
MPKFQYLTCCVNSTAEAINAMTDTAREITFGTFARHCDWRELASQMGYQRGGLVLSRDWAVSYYRSTYKGRPCYYMVHSCIEYIFA